MIGAGLGIIDVFGTRILFTDETNMIGWDTMTPPQLT